MRFWVLVALGFGLTSLLGLCRARCCLTADRCVRPRVRRRCGPDHARQHDDAGGPALRRQVGGLANDHRIRARVRDQLAAIANEEARRYVTAGGRSRSATTATGHSKIETTQRYWRAMERMRPMERVRDPWETRFEAIADKAPSGLEPLLSSYR